MRKWLSFIFRRRFIPMEKRKTFVKKFTPVERLEQLIDEYLELCYMDTSLSLDRDGHSAAQIQYYQKERPVFFRNHGTELLAYLQPYTAVPKSAQFNSVEGRRAETLKRLLKEAKKAESE